MKNYAKILMFTFAAVLLAGCHTCNPESKECFPMCKKDREENNLLTEGNWKSFKNFKAIPYVSVGLPLIDNSAKIITKLSNQFVDEVVIPYVELDKDNLIQIYYQFLEDVKDVEKRNNCNTAKALELTWQDWMSQPNGPANCAKLRKAIPFINNMRAGNQFMKGFTRISGDVERLLRTLPAQINQFVNSIKTTEGKVKAGIAGAQVTANLTRLGIACSYLYVLKADSSKQNKQIEDFVAQMNSGK